jgi:hypothetical protein
MSQTRTKVAVRGAKVKTKSGRRPPVKVKSGPELPLLPIAAGGILVVAAMILIIYGVANNRSASASTMPTVAGIPCDSLQHTQVHYHVALQIVYQGNVTNLPPGLGIYPSETAPSCYYWLHVHAADANTIHIESPASKTFTLGQFFAVWNAWAQKTGHPSVALDATHVATFTLTPDQKLVVYISNTDSKSPAELYTGDASTIVLTKHEVITLEVAPPTVTPPPPFTFQPGL